MSLLEARRGLRICESFNDAQEKRYIYGMGGDCLASLAKDDYAVELEEVRTAAGGHQVQRVI